MIERIAALLLRPMPTPLPARSAHSARTLPREQHAERLYYSPLMAGWAATCSWMTRAHGNCAYLPGFDAAVEPSAVETLDPDARWLVSAV